MRKAASFLLRGGAQAAGQRGMSIIELTMTVIVLGITFVFALKGSVLVDNMRAFMTQNKIQHLQNRIFLYQAQFNSLPGDDPQAGRRWRIPEAVIRVGDAFANSRGDGRVQGDFFDSLAPNGEQFMAWRHLRRAGLLDGDPEAVGLSALPENAYGGVIGLDEGNLGQKVGSMCTTRIPGAGALRIDKALDDGVINTGLVVGTSRYSVEENNHFSAPDSEPYNLEKEYIICVPIFP